MSLSNRYLRSAWGMYRGSGTSVCMYRKKGEFEGSAGGRDTGHSSGNLVDSCDFRDTFRLAGGLETTRGFGRDRDLQRPTLSF
mmetsp:Transcript_151/g.382  ORF Transcript_151/g.382 Transcript_151/m.382 type:complete len:83 (+) Transcript_151:220-468(+)